MRTIGIICYLSLLLTSCQTSADSETQSNPEKTYSQIEGNAQGTTYRIIYMDPKNRDLTNSVDSILKSYDEELSGYSDNSILSQLNNSSDHIFDLSSFPHSKNFEECYEISKEIHYYTNGQFNPAVYPLVDYWGFFDETKKESIDSDHIDSLLDYVHFEEEFFKLSNHTISKKYLESKLDFNAIAQGHSVDVVAAFLDNEDIHNYMVEIGGEVHCNGLNPDAEKWTIGIEQPIENSKPGEFDFQFIAQLGDMSLATSGNYRKFYEIDGKKYSHTINPVTGFPVNHSLLSVTVVSKSCADADAYATSFMAMGMLNAMEFMNNNPGLELNAYFVFDNNGVMKTAQTTDFAQFIKS